MKRLLTVVLILLAYVSFAQKIGHINTAEILKKLPAVDSAQAQLQRFAANLQNQNETLTNEYQNKLEKYQAESPNMAVTIKKDRELELQQLENRIKKFQDEAQKEVEGKQKELLEPIMNNLQTVIKDIAKEKGYDYVFDTSSGVVLYYKDSDDISEFVKKKLNIK